MDVEARRAFWMSVRSFAARGKTVIFATHYLEEADAYADRAVLMSHGRVVADGATSEIRARVGTRTIRATLPGRRRDRPCLAAGRDRGRSSWRGDRPDLLRLRRGDPGAARGLPRRTRPRDRQRRTRGRLHRADRRPTTTLRPTPSNRRHWYEIARLHAFRAGADVPQHSPAGVLARLPAGPVLHHRGAEPQRAQLQRVRDLDPALLHGRARFVRGDVSADLERDADRHRADGRLDATAPDHPAEDERVLLRQGRDRVRDGGRDDRDLCTRRGSRSASASAPVAGSR